MRLIEEANEKHRAAQMKIKEIKENSQMQMKAVAQKAKYRDCDDYVVRMREMEFEYLADKDLQTRAERTKDLMESMRFPLNNN